MVRQKSNPARFEDVELWALACALSGKPIPDDLPIGEKAYNIIRDLSYISLEWRGQSLHQRIGGETFSYIQQWVNQPMPVYTIGPGVNYSVTPAYGSPSPAVQPVQVPQRQHLIPADDLKRLPLPKYALESYPIYQQCLNVLVGPSGAGKSFVAVDIAGTMSLAGATVVYIAGEGLFGYSARWEVWKASRRMKECPNLIFYDQPVNFMDSEEIVRFIGEIAPRKPAMIIVDTVARCMVGADENSTRDMGLFVGTCDKLIHTLGTGVLAIHHTGKDGKMRGNTSLFGAADSVLFLRRDESDISVFNNLDMGGKNKNNQEADPLRLTLVPQETIVDGKLFQSAILVDSYKVVADEQESQIKGRERAILEALEPQQNGLTVDQINDATNIPKSSIYRTCNRLKKGDLILQVGEKYTITDEGRNQLFNH